MRKRKGTALNFSWIIDSSGEAIEMLVPRPCPRLVESESLRVVTRHWYWNKTTNQPTKQTNSLDFSNMQPGLRTSEIGKTQDQSDPGVGNMGYMCTWREGEEGVRGWDGWMASLMQWAWTWADFRRWWGTGRPGVLQSMWLQRVRPDCVTEPQCVLGGGVWRLVSGDFTEKIRFSLKNCLTPSSAHIREPCESWGSIHRPVILSFEYVTLWSDTLALLLPLGGGSFMIY